MPLSYISRQLSVWLQSGVAIPFSALSGLSNDPSNGDILYAVEDSFYKSSRFFEIDTTSFPAVLTDATTIKDTNGIFASFEVPNGLFTAELLAAMINDDDDKTVNIDPEGIASDGGDFLYIASEGSGTVGDEERPVESLNFIFKVDHDGVIHDVITLPDEVNAVQLRYGLEGIAYHPDGFLVACLQRAWDGYDGPLIGIYSILDEEWVGYVQFPLDEPESQDGGWVGLSDISFIGGDIFYVLERDNKGNLDAAVKRIYAVDFSFNVFEGEMVAKYPVADLVETIADTTGGLPLEKLEGMAINDQGLWVVNDNDGVDDNSGEIQLFKIIF